MRGYVARSAAALACVGMGAATPAASTPVSPVLEDGRAVIDAVDARPRAEDQVLWTTWRLARSSGRERVRRTRSYFRDYRHDGTTLRSKRLIVFESPPDLRDTAFLVWSYSGTREDDDRWIYLPALRKVRRIAGQDRGKSFAGTEFHYEDLADLDVGEEEHRLIRVEERDGLRIYVVESTPLRADASYARRIQFVDGTEFTIPRIEYYDHHGRLDRLLTVEWQQVDGIWEWSRLHMRNVRTGNRTLIEVDAVEHSSGLDDDAFSESSLRYGVP